MSSSHENSKFYISDTIREYIVSLAYNYKKFIEARNDYKNHIITSHDLIKIIITMFTTLAVKYKLIVVSIEIKKIKEFRLNVYAQLADLIKYFHEKSIEMDAGNIEPEVVDRLLSLLIEKTNLYLNELNQIAAIEQKLYAPSARKKTCGLCLKMPSIEYDDDFLRNYSSEIKDKRFLFDNVLPDQDEVDSVKCGSNFSSCSRPSSDCSDEVPSYSPTEGRSPVPSDTEDDLKLNQSISQLIPDWEDFLNEAVFKWYALGGEKPSTECFEYMHVYLGGRRLSSLQTPVSPAQESSVPLENGPVIFRRSGARRSQSSSEEAKQILLTETNIDKHIVFKLSNGISVIQYAELDALVVYATENLESEFCSIFVLTYQSFITADDLIEKLIFRFNTFADHRKKNTYMLIIKIMEASNRYFITEPLLTALVNFIYQLVKRSEIEWAFTLHNIFEQKLNEYHKMKMLVNAIPEYLGDGEYAGTILDFKPNQIAEQMTLMAYELFTKIDVSELLVSEVKGATPNATAFIHHCDKLSYWVTTMIGKLRTQRDVQKHIKYLVKVMKCLKEYRDYSSCWAILVGMQTTYIYKITKKYENLFCEFTDLFSFSANYKNYRNLLKDSKLPRIPLLCIALHDLIYISEATKRFKPAELENSINFYRIWRQYKYITVFKEEKAGYPFKKNYKVLTFFRNFDNYYVSLNNAS